MIDQAGAWRRQAAKGPIRTALAESIAQYSKAIVLVAMLATDPVRQKMMKVHHHINNLVHDPTDDLGKAESDAAMDARTEFDRAARAELGVQPAPDLEQKKAD